MIESLVEGVLQAWLGLGDLLSHRQFGFACVLYIHASSILIWKSFFLL
jgi:hypothetical protein